VPSGVVHAVATLAERAAAAGGSHSRVDPPCPLSRSGRLCFGEQRRHARGSSRRLGVRLWTPFPVAEVRPLRVEGAIAARLCARRHGCGSPGCARSGRSLGGGAPRAEPRTRRRVPATPGSCTSHRRSTGDAPDPPAGDLRVVEVGVAPHPLPELRPAHEPAVAGVQVRLVHRPVRPGRKLLRVRLQRPPEVGDVAVQVVHRLDARLRGPGQEHRHGAGEGLDVVGHVPEPLPHQAGDAAFPPEPRERSAEGHRFPLTGPWRNATLVA
jgi:hypothetical protein